MLFLLVILFGIKLYAEGVLVVGMSEIEGQRPYLESGIEEGDMIIAVNGVEVRTTSELANLINESGESEAALKLIRDEKEKTVAFRPARTRDDEFKLGLWVRDGAARGWRTYVL